jgi:Uma2 family endonuclease
MALYVQTYPRSTHDDFRRIADANPSARVEIDALGTITVTPPAGAASGHRNARLTHAMLAWADTHDYIAFDSSTGFALADGSILSPDAAVVSLANWNALTEEQREAFLTIVPEVAIELASKSDRPNELKAKLLQFRAGGTAFVALIDPYRSTVWTDGTPPIDFTVDLESFLIEARLANVHSNEAEIDTGPAVGAEVYE